MNEEPAHIENWKNTGKRSSKDYAAGIDDYLKQLRPKFIGSYEENGHIVHQYEAAHADGSVTPKRVR